MELLDLRVNQAREEHPVILDPLADRDSLVWPDHLENPANPVRLDHPDLPDLMAISEFVASADTLETVVSPDLSEVLVQLDLPAPLDLMEREDHQDLKVLLARLVPKE